ncbi:hypothetical protein [Thermithiobacillus plumbiphilus]|uniref:Uncharacterized protein n=1 Tax=Thermithiobacillus plumbiphilus TaxID=1729899 RepID=A0ABU9D5A6_9PROT
MPIWRTADVNTQPALNLVNWRVMQLGKSRHFVGYCPENHEGRVSTAIIAFDPATRQGVTASGRIYVLRGPSGFDTDADYVWALWRAQFGAGLEALDVSGEYAPEHTSH